MAETSGPIILLLFLFGKLFMTDAKEANVTCIVHDDCLLPCSFRPPGAVVIHWYKQQIPVHSYYYNRDQFGLQNKHFSGRTCLFNGHIPHGNASLLLKRVKVQDKGRYKCYTSTRKGNQEIFVNLYVKSPILSVAMEIDEEVVTCTSHNVYPVPLVTWSTHPPSAQEVLENSTIKTTDHKGLFNVESTLRILGNRSDYTYICSFTSADKTQAWIASRKIQESETQEEGHGLCIPCIALLDLQNFTLTWTFTSSGEPTVILRYDSKTGHTLNMWEGQAELDQDQLLLGNGSLLLHETNREEHSGTYTCTFTGLQSRHMVQTKVNITAATLSVNKRRGQRSRWSTAASVAFVFFTIMVALPHCVRKRGVDVGTHRYNGAGHVNIGLHKDTIDTASYIIRQHEEDGKQQQELQSEEEDKKEESSPDVAADDPTEALEPHEDAEEQPAEGHIEENNSCLSVI